MTRIKINSDKLVSVGYEPDAELLELEFPGNGIYEYHKVHPVIYMGLMHTKAKEAYFNKHIKDKFVYNVIRESSL
jgi:KTSC domain